MDGHGVLCLEIFVSPGVTSDDHFGRAEVSLTLGDGL